jgi:hypothetical protein
MQVAKIYIYIQVNSVLQEKPQKYVTVKYAYIGLLCPRTQLCTSFNISYYGHNIQYYKYN